MIQCQDERYYYGCFWWNKGGFIAYQSGALMCYSRRNIDTTVRGVWGVPYRKIGPITDDVKNFPPANNGLVSCLACEIEPLWMPPVPQVFSVNVRDAATAEYAWVLTVERESVEAVLNGSKIPPSWLPYFHGEDIMKGLRRCYEGFETDDYIKIGAKRRRGRTSVSE